MDLSLDNFIAFVEEQWWVILIAAALLIIVIKVVKALVKWLIVAAIIIALFLYGMNYEPLRDAVGSVAEYTIDMALQAMPGEAEQAVYSSAEDGTYTVESDNIKLTGSHDSDKVTVYFRGLKIAEVSVTDVIEAYIQTARGNGG